MKKYVQVGIGGRSRFYYEAIAGTFKDTAKLVGFCDVNQTRMDYANKMIQEILEEAISCFRLNQAVCVHRLGRVEISGCAVVVITGAGHRKEAYDANSYIIDRVKNEVPIWKHEFFADNTSEWGQNCDCVTHSNEHHHHHEKAK